MESNSLKKGLFRFPRPDGPVIRVVMPNETRTRLANTCFRGTEIAKSGNLCSWSSFEAMMEDPLVVDGMLGELDGIFAQRNFDGNWSFTLNFPARPIGWSSTILRPVVHAHELDYRPLNKRASAMFFSDPEYPAPLTHKVTFVCTLRTENVNVGTALIQSIYPGADVGEIRGNMTKRTQGRVWIDFDNPGGECVLEDEE